MATEKKEELVKAQDPVKVEWLDGDKHHKAGSVSTVHKICAEGLVKRKKAKIVK
ncbi:MAG: hypothetical protein LBG96_16730 [Tannerella sp.]|jgi:hypothetical protein|nr:hypothetical protein [Tannerella sp.]